MNHHTTDFTTISRPPSRERTNSIILGIDASQANRAIRSGTEWYAFYLITEFKKLLRGRNDVKVRLYFRDPPRQDILENWPENWEVRILKWRFRFFWGQIRLSWEMIVRPPDILFCPAHTIPVIHPKKTFTTLHDIGFVDNPELYDKLSLWYHRFSAWLAVKSAHHIFTISEFSKNRIIDAYHCPPEKVSVIYLGVAHNILQVENSSILRKYGLWRKRYILFIGRLEPKKNILGIVKAYEKFLSSLRVEVAASGDLSQADKPAGKTVAAARDNRPGSDGFPDLVFAGRKVRATDAEEYIENRPKLRDRIKFLGYIEEGDKRALLANALIFVFPTFYEGFGLPILEAQAARAPVITSNSTSNPEIAGEGAVLVDPKSTEEISSAIAKIANNPEFREKLIKLGLTNLQRFDWRATASRTIEGILESGTRLHG